MRHTMAWLALALFAAACEDPAPRRPVTNQVSQAPTKKSEPQLPANVSTQDAAWSVLRQAIESNNNDAALKAIGALRDLGPEAVPALEKALYDKRPSVRIAAANGLLLRGDERGLTLVEESLHGGAARATLAALRNAPDKVGISLLQRCKDDEVYALAVGCAAALVARGDNSGADRLRALIAEPKATQAIATQLRALPEPLAKELFELLLTQPRPDELALSVAIVSVARFSSDNFAPLVRRAYTNGKNLTLRGVAAADLLARGETADVNDVLLATNSADTGGLLSTLATRRETPAPSLLPHLFTILESAASPEYPFAFRSLARLVDNGVVLTDLSTLRAVHDEVPDLLGKKIDPASAPTSAPASAPAPVSAPVVMPPKRPTYDPSKPSSHGEMHMDTPEPASRPAIQRDPKEAMRLRIKQAAATMAAAYLANAGDEAGRKTMQGLLDWPNAGAGLAAAVGALRSPASRDLLLLAAKHPVETVRMSALRVLLDDQKKGTPIPEDLWAALEKDLHAPIRIEIIYATKYLPADKREALLRRGLADANAQVKIAAAHVVLAKKDIEDPSDKDNED